MPLIGTPYASPEEQFQEDLAFEVQELMACGDFTPAQAQLYKAMREAEFRDNEICPAELCCSQFDLNCNQARQLYWRMVDTVCPDYYS